MKRPHTLIMILVFISSSSVGWHTCFGQQNLMSLRGPSIVLPGRYTISPHNSNNLCLNLEPAFGARIEHIALHACSHSRRQLFDIVPTTSVLRTSDGLPSGAYTIRTADDMHCLTGARGVVIGPPSVDVTACDFRGSGSCDVSADQTWSLRASSPSLSAVEYGGPAYGAGGDQIWAVRDDDINNDSADLIIFNSNDVHAQRFVFTLVGPTPGLPSPIIPCATSTGYMMAPDGLRWAGFANNTGLFFVGVSNTRLPRSEGNNLFNCRQICLNETSCKAWRFNQRAADPCITFSGPFNPAPERFSSSGILRP